MIYDYEVIKTPFSYIVYCNNTFALRNAIPNSDYAKCIYSISLDGKKFWERNLGEHEIGILCNSLNYENKIIDIIFLDDESCVYFYGTRDGSIILEDNGYWHYPVHKLRNINIKNYRIVYEAEVPIVEAAYQKYSNPLSLNGWDISDMFDTGESIRIEYVEYSGEWVVDDKISGAGHDEFTVHNRYYCDLNKDTGEIMASGKY